MFKLLKNRTNFTTSSKIFKMSNLAHQNKVLSSEKKCRRDFTELNKGKGVLP